MLDKHSQPANNEKNLADKESLSTSQSNEGITLSESEVAALSEKFEEEMTRVHLDDERRNSISEEIMVSEMQASREESARLNAVLEQSDRQLAEYRSHYWLEQNIYLGLVAALLIACLGLWIYMQVFRPVLH